MNYFAHPSAAERYARDRPYFHPLVIERVRAFLKLDGPVPVALDVACGTGMSTLALTKIATAVIGADISPAMLSQASAHPRIRYLEAPAEHLPLEDHSVDLITVFLAFHWLDRTRFLAEAHRILRPGGTLVICHHGFQGKMKENPDFTRWCRDIYYPRFPTPPRHKEPLTDEDARRYGLTVAGHERYTYDIVYTPEQFIRQQNTHSNVIAQVEQGSETLEETSAWALETVRPFFVASTGTFPFGGEILYLQPVSA
ncbi:MAG: class I SAM-dependent methyltransferase [Chthoniobacter sp.]